MTRIRIENVVASTSLGSELDLQSIALSLPGAEYEPDRFPGLIYRLPEPKTAVLLFHSGKVVCTGGKSWNEVEESIRTVSRLIRQTGQKVVKQPTITIQNIVATSDLGGDLNLNSIAVTLGLDHVEYEPEQFPGLVCRLDEPRVVILLFGSGKLVCTGARRPADVALAVQKITKELQQGGLLDPERTREPAPPGRVKRKGSAPGTAPPAGAPDPSAADSVSGGIAPVIA